MGRWQEEAGSPHKGDRQGSCLCPCPARLLCPRATADIRRVSAILEAWISDVCENYTFKFPIKQLLIV